MYRFVLAAVLTVASSVPGSMVGSSPTLSRHSHEEGLGSPTRSYPVLKARTPLPVTAVASSKGSGDPSPTAPTVTLPATRTVKVHKFFCLKAGGTCKSLKWIIPEGLDQLPPEIPLSDKTAIVLQGDTEGVYRVSVYGALGDQVSDLATCEVTVGKPAPPPPGPGPGPGPGPAPIPDAGFRALIVVDTTQEAKLPPDQEISLKSSEVRQYLNSKCVKGPDGKTAEWRIWSTATDPTGESDLWKKAFARPRKEHPWILISNGKTGFEGPLPKNKDDLLALLKKYEGS